MLDFDVFETQIKAILSETKACKLSLAEYQRKNNEIAKVAAQRQHDVFQSKHFEYVTIVSFISLVWIFLFLNVTKYSMRILAACCFWAALSQAAWRSCWFCYTLINNCTIVPLYILYHCIYFARNYAMIQCAF